MESIMNGGRPHLEKAPAVLYAVVSFLFISTTYINIKMSSVSTLFLLLRIPVWILEVLIGFLMLKIHYTDPHSKDYSKYKCYVGPPRKIFMQSTSNIKRLETNQIDDTVFYNPDNALDFCLECQTVKYPRVTHCDICNTCILRYDHHDTILETCIGQHNYAMYYVYVLGVVIVTGINCILFFVNQFCAMLFDFRLLFLSFLFANASLLFLYYRKLYLLIYQLQHNFTQAESEKFQNSRLIRCPYHYDTGDITLNVRDAFY
ncbi:palmitoyltransferase ERF2, putative [Entamoeba invadens IP1]|uniref:Palmitoyltransferase n=1 Tax=Entamoeba invadens IP1 TaxID=370355 RepID=A0A0A1TZ90_ENTIV|nr:palmitoyltransferase ERF2, putative [Entamoeba invadens IP1]ELP86869.1 palmitoyltransferase ERF2, putative [Entamoeba invadens IP1]|eukprot:XP_004253640.1 palmitoyltransferase ERF2, putative [Entamoeba invadens IP1]